ncbi:MAG: polysaccharide deacetylase family protein [Chromatiaceae bacterium]
MPDLIPPPFHLREVADVPEQRAGHRRASALVRASVLLHVLVPAAALAQPALWPWWLGLILLDHFALTAAGLWPRSALLGPNWRELPATARQGRAVALTIDDGPDPEVTPRALEILARREVRATFFCIGERAQAHPELIAAMVAAGHAVENHSHRHSHRFSLFGPGRMRADLTEAQDTLGRLAGTAPRFFRAPAGLRNPFLEPVLSRLGLQLVSWSRRGFDTREGDPQRVLGRLARGLAPGAILLLHDGNAARSPEGRPVILEVLPDLIERIHLAGLEPVTLREALPATAVP